MEADNYKIDFNYSNQNNTSDTMSKVQQASLSPSNNKLKEEKRMKYLIENKMHNIFDQSLSNADGTDLPWELIYYLFSRYHEQI